MIAPRFTPGPWEMRDGSLHRRHWLVDAPGRRFIAQIDGPPDEEGEANAQLISAAPGLYAMAQLALDIMESLLSGILECCCLLDESLQPRRETLDECAKLDVLRLEAAIADARAILAKARGEQA